MSLAQREGSSRPRPSTLGLPRKSSARDLRNTSRTQLLKGDDASDEQIPPMPTRSVPKGTPARALSIDTLAQPREAGSEPLKSAPACRAIRRLPSLPVPHSSRPSIPHASSEISSAPLRSLTMTTLSCGKRPLPSPPSPRMNQGMVSTIDANSVSASSPPTSSCRLSKPLPTPVQKPERDSLPFPLPLQPLQPIEEVITPPTTPPKDNPRASHSSSLRTPTQKSPKQMSSVNHTNTPTAPKHLAHTLRSKGAPTAVMLHTRMVLEREHRLNTICLSADDEYSSDSSASTVTTTEPVFSSPRGRNDSPKKPTRKIGEAAAVVGIASEKDQKHAADYAFVLANRILYQQTSNDPPGAITSKWVREVKGKRYTEQNFDNVMQALRTL